MVVSGSTTMQSMARAWLDRFIKFHPEVSYTKGQEGTDAAIKEISDNPQVIAGASRPLTEQELNNLKSSKCKEPMAVIVALDPLALYVHKENPLASVTPEQLESIFRAAGSGKPHALKWGDLGLTGEWAGQPIRIHGRSDVSGTTGFIKQWILGGGELAKAAQIHETNIAVTQGVGKDKFGVALCGFGDHNADVRAVPLVLSVGPKSDKFSPAWVFDAGLITGCFSGCFPDAIHGYSRLFTMRLTRFPYRGKS